MPSVFNKRIFKAKIAQALLCRRYLVSGSLRLFFCAGCSGANDLKILKARFGLVWLNMNSIRNFYI